MSFKYGRQVFIWFNQTLNLGFECNYINLGLSVKSPIPSYKYYIIYIYIEFIKHRLGSLSALSDLLYAYRNKLCNTIQVVYNKQQRVNECVLLHEWLTKVEMTKHNYSGSLRIINVSVVNFYCYQFGTILYIQVVLNKQQ